MIYKREWFESKFSPTTADNLGDGWGHRWRGSQKLRYSICLKVLKPSLLQSSPLNVLDIGCALGDFTLSAWQVNPENQFSGTDIAKNAIRLLSQKYPTFQLAVAALPEVPFQDDSFDCIICLEVLSYFNSKAIRQSIQEIHRAMRENGTLLLSITFSGAWMEEFATQ